MQVLGARAGGFALATAHSLTPLEPKADVYGDKRAPSLLVVGVKWKSTPKSETGLLFGEG